MQHHAFQRLPKLPVWGLLLVWLLLGSLALAEQVDLLIETSAQDEQALYGLVLAIKPVHTGIDYDTMIVHALNVVEHDRSALAFLGGGDRPDPLLFTRTSTVPLFIVLSCYRI